MTEKKTKKQPKKVSKKATGTAGSIRRKVNRLREAMLDNPGLRAEFRSNPRLVLDRQGISDPSHVGRILFELFLQENLQVCEIISTPVSCLGSERCSIATKPLPPPQMRIHEISLSRDGESIKISLPIPEDWNLDADTTFEKP